MLRARGTPDEEPTLFCVYNKILDCWTQVKSDFAITAASQESVFLRSIHVSETRSLDALLQQDKMYKQHLDFRRNLTAERASVREQQRSADVDTAASLPRRSRKGKRKGKGRKGKERERSLSVVREDHEHRPSAEEDGENSEPEDEQGKDIFESSDDYDTQRTLPSNQSTHSPRHHAPSVDPSEWAGISSNEEEPESLRSDAASSLAPPSQHLSNKGKKRRLSTPSEDADIEEDEQMIALLQKAQEEDDALSGDNDGDGNELWQLPQTKKWPRDFYTYDIAECFREVVLKNAGGNKETGRKNTNNAPPVPTVEDIFAEHFPGVKFSRSTYYGHVARFAAASASVRREAVEHKHTELGKWKYLMRKVPRPGAEADNARRRLVRNASPAPPAKFNKPRGREQNRSAHESRYRSHSRSHRSRRRSQSQSQSQSRSRSRSQSPRYPSGSGSGSGSGSRSQRNHNRPRSQSRSRSRSDQRKSTTRRSKKRRH